MGAGEAEGDDAGETADNGVVVLTGVAAFGVGNVDVDGGRVPTIDKSAEGVMIDDARPVAVGER